ncbi:MAG TPA: sulfite oxidase [Micromonosporaceae bacterium]
MVARLSDISVPGRLAADGEGLSLEELALAARNHGMPLEALRYDVTPIGLHYLLIHYDIPAVDGQDWRLSVDGAVARPLSLDLPTLLDLPTVTRRVTMECAGNGRARLSPRPVSQPWLVEAVGTADWTGTPLRAVLAEAGVGPDAVDVVFTGADHGVERGIEQDYQRSLPIAEAMREEVLLVHHMNGQPLPPQHGYPLRLVVPGWYGMAQVKWLRQITVTDRPFTGFQQDVAYRYRQEPDEHGEPVTRMAPRALIQPPGFPDFMSRTRIVRPGAVDVSGRAWSGEAPVVRVEVSVDGGTTWADADVTVADAPGWVWRRWSWPWQAEPGQYRLCARATDAAGRTQPTVQPWNRGGFANNLVHQVDVVCLE